METLPRIKHLELLPNYRLSVEFDDRKVVVYNVEEDIDTIEEFRMLKQIPGLWNQAQLDQSRTCVFWNDRIDLSSDTIYEYGKIPYDFTDVPTPIAAETK